MCHPSDLTACALCYKCVTRLCQSNVCTHKSLVLSLEVQKIAHRRAGDTLPPTQQTTKKDYLCATVPFTGALRVSRAACGALYLGQTSYLRENFQATPKILLTSRAETGIFRHEGGPRYVQMGQLEESSSQNACRIELYTSGALGREEYRLLHRFDSQGTGPGRRSNPKFMLWARQGTGMDSIARRALSAGG